MKILVFIIWLILGIFYFFISNNQQNKCCTDSKSDQSTEQIVNPQDSSDKAGLEPIKKEVQIEKDTTATILIKDFSYSILFPYNSYAYDLDKEQQDSLAKAANLLLSNDRGKLWITGHSDSIGSQEVNQIVGMKRANFVAEHLKGLGADPSKLVVKSSGEELPVAANSTNQGRAMN